MKKKVFTLSLAFLGLFVNTSCGDDEPSQESEPIITLSTYQSETDNNARKYSAASIETNLKLADLEVTSTENWCSSEISTEYRGYYPLATNNNQTNSIIKPLSTYYINLTLTENTSYDVRTARITVKHKSSAKEASFLLTQKGTEAPHVSVYSQLITFQGYGGSKSNTIYTNVDCSRLEVASDASWVTCEIPANNNVSAEKARLNANAVSYSATSAKYKTVDSMILLVCSVEANPSETPRTATVTVKVKDYPSAYTTFKIEQDGASLQYKLVKVEGGTFTMGGDDYHSKPKHTVTLSSFYIGKYEVTQALWKMVMGNNPSYFKGNDLPVENVSWDDCQAFISKLNQMTGYNYRLPTEAEWEYAARGGSGTYIDNYIYCGSNDIDAVAWYSGNSESHTHVVASKKHNWLGLYDMSGNVFEWCQDWYGSYSSSAQTNPTGPSSGSHRVVRGGGWDYLASDCTVWCRYGMPPSTKSNTFGFRIVRPI